MTSWRTCRTTDRRPTVPEIRYMKQRREELGGQIPARLHEDMNTC